MCGTHDLVETNACLGNCLLRCAHSERNALVDKDFVQFFDGGRVWVVDHWVIRLSYRRASLAHGSDCSYGGSG